MAKKKNVKIIHVVFLLLAFLVIVGIVYATFSQELNINGSATVRSTSWKINFDNLRQINKYGTAKELVAPKIVDEATIIEDYAVILNSPGDRISYMFDIVNSGSYPAVISSISIPRPNCTGTGTNALNDAGNVCGHLSYNLTYTNNQPVRINDKLEVGETKTCILTLNYNEFDNAELLAKSDIAVSNLKIAIVYSQSGLARID